MFGSIKGFAERAARAFDSPPQEKEPLVWVATRNCLCGYARLSFGRFDDAMICRQCGLTHVLGVIDPIARLIPESKVTPEMKRL